jgi:hypothetical protein
MDKGRREALEQVVAGMWRWMEETERKYEGEDAVPAEEAAEDRRALGRRLGRLYLAFAGVLIDRLGEPEGRKAIMEAMRTYSHHCARARKQGQVDLPERGIHSRMEVGERDGRKYLRAEGCGIAQEFRSQGREKLGALYCYVDPCSFMLTFPNIKLCHTRIEMLGDDCCEFDLRIASDREMKDVTEPGRDYLHVDPVIEKGTRGRLLPTGGRD